MAVNKILFYLIASICSCNLIFAQTDVHSSYIDTLTKRWHIKNNAIVVGFGIQSQPYTKDSITVYVRYGNDYTQYQFKGQMLDSLLYKKRYITDVDMQMKKIIADHICKFPPPPSSN